MKLEFESNAVSSPLVGNHIPSEFDEHHSSPEVMEMLREGIKSAQDGDRAEARNLLLRVTEADAKNENAWLWLASISEYPEELLVFLNNVLQINPDNERALEWAKATKSLIAKTFVQRGIDSAKDDQKKFAKQCFLQAIVHDPESELAYLWLASVADSSEEKMSHLQKVLSLNPENENALSSLKNAKEQNAKALLPKANTAAISGRREEAVLLLEEIFEDAPDFEDAWMLKAHLSESFDDKIEAFERVLEINPENPVARANVDSLKMFALNSDVESAVPMPVDNFEDSQAIFGSGRLEESDVEAFPAATDSFEPAEEPVTEQYVASDEMAADLEYQEEEEEAVAFEDIAPALEQADEDNSDDEGIFESEDLFGLDASDDNPEDDQKDEKAEASFSDDSDEGPFEQPEESENQSFDSEAAAVDHDYVSENVDLAEESDEAPDELEFDAESEFENADAEAPADEDSGEPEYYADANASDDATEEGEDEGDNEASFESDEEPEMEAHFDPEEEAGEEIAVAESDDGTDQQEPEIEASKEPEMPSFESAESIRPELPSEQAAKYRACQYCSETNENQAFACHSCKAIFTISDIEMILSHTKADQEVISRALEKMEVEKTLRGVDVEELKHLGIGYLNLKDYRKGFEYLQEAARKDKSDVILVSQIDALAVRLAEIEDHEREREPATASKKILVVDDSPTVRKLISGKLEKCGHEPICAVDGMDALAKINDEVPDLILLDITMPRMDGYQVCKLIRSNDATKDVPVVMISGKDGFFDKVRGRMAGTSNYITKPFGPETLMKTVNEYIQ